MYDLNDLIWLLLFAFAFLFWWQGQQVKERALLAARKHCADSDVQLLDETIAQVKMRLRRGPDGRMGIWRQYQFEFATSGDARYKGKMEMQGNKLLSITLDTHRF